jgi:5-methylcytosine-specific restriction endonuclease McrA
MEPHTLLLNAWMQPHEVIGWQQSIVLLVTEKIDVLESYDAEIRSPSVTFKLPAVARLRKEFSPHKHGVKFSRLNIYTRDQFACAYCGKKKAIKDLNYDHVLPRCKGGRTTWENVITACPPCNRRKGNRTPEQARMPLLFKPYRPKVLPMTPPFLISTDKIQDLWKPYLEGVALTA